MSAGVLLIAAASSLAMYNAYIERKADNHSKRVALEIAGQILHKKNAKQEGEDLYITIDHVKYSGYLIVPQFDLELPIAAEWNFKQLLVSPCTYSGNRKEKNWVVAGHNYKRHFLPLQELQIGDFLYFIDASGNKILYEVVKTEVLDPVQIDEMKSSGYSFSLFTCTYDGTSRFTVRCQEYDDSVRSEGKKTESAAQTAS